MSAESDLPPDAGADDTGGLGGEDEPLELTALLHTALDKGVVLHGDVTIAVADIDLVKLNLGLLLSAIATIEQMHASSGRPPLFSSDRPTQDRTTRDRTTQDRTTLAAALGSLPGHGERATPPAAPEPPPPPSATPDGASLNAVAQGLPERINADAAGVESGLARLVLTLIEVLRKVLEHQAVRRMDGGRLSPAEIERLGLALSKLNDRMQELKQLFGLSDRDLEIDLGPLGRLR